MAQQAQKTFAALAALAAESLQPEGRANATAASLRQVGVIGGELPLTMADCAAGFSVLAQAKAEDEPGHVAGRRRTCGELAELAGPKESGDPAREAAVFRAVEAKFSGSDDPRQAAMAATAAREAAELEAATA